MAAVFIQGINTDHSYMDINLSTLDINLMSPPLLHQLVLGAKTIISHMV